MGSNGILGIFNYQVCMKSEIASLLPSLFSDFILFKYEGNIVAAKSKGIG